MALRSLCKEMGWQTVIYLNENYFSKRSEREKKFTLNEMECAVARVGNIHQQSIMIESNCMYLYALCIHDYRNIGVFVRTYEKYL